MKNRPPFVYIDTQALLFKRYVGKTCTHAFKAIDLVEAGWVEQFRLRPEEFLGTNDDPSYA